jgi:excisionase family DNA binding protein
MAEQREFLKVSEVAQRLGVHENTARNWIDDGRIDAIRPGPRTLRVPVAEVERLARPLEPEDFME